MIRKNKSHIFQIFERYFTFFCKTYNERRKEILNMMDQIYVALLLLERAILSPAVNERTNERRHLSLFNVVVIRMSENARKRYQSSLRKCHQQTKLSSRKRRLFSFPPFPSTYLCRVAFWRRKTFFFPFLRTFFHVTWLRRVASCFASDKTDMDEVKKV